MSDERAELVRQIVSFVGAGLLAAAAHYALYAALVGYGVMAPLPATSMGFLVGTAVSYGINVRITFRAETTWSTFVRFWGVTGLGGALNAAVVEGCVRLGVHWGVAGVLGIVAGATFNFTVHRLWTFKAR